MPPHKTKLKKTKTGKKKSIKTQSGGELQNQKETKDFKDYLKLTKGDQVDSLKKEAESGRHYPGPFPIPECSIL